MKTIQGHPSPEAERILQALRKAERQKLEEKRRLGHYYVDWQDGRPVFISDDAPVDGTCTGKPPAGGGQG
jgi:hypothetical protein